ncbi:bifunctional UDP-N-acetylglucosamine diphosphorylase/glucosamine-1-phosphate N-acetyltransferase GlmU [Dongia sedimenti]|uniref:Bifunctional protein GlmU n=1 Tax=Dongia sedimenti TaxID=3064282 RepID=A0ABU0YSS2_9PROT|nr:bifunctional UDP-N-acetylglucosamine diphosphorylase/glucosamine-1-phosphate N-acetyltransferase GlmU [Rhodospirillaceae bacterium R-7]
MGEIAAIVLAAGKGTRMKSALPKVLHRIAGRSMIGHVLDNLAALKVAKTAVVIAPGMESVAREVAPHPTVVQQQQLGTGHAVAATKATFGSFDGTVLVLFGDAPFVGAATMTHLVRRREAADRPAVVVLGVRPEDTAGFGRLVTDGTGNLERIVEQRDATPEELEIDLCNSGVMAVEGAALWNLIDAIENKNAKSEYYLTDIVAIAQRKGRTVAVVEADEDEIPLIGVNDRIELAQAEAICQQMLRADALANGATMIDPPSVFLSKDTRLGQDVTIGPNVVFGPGVTVADNVEIRAFCHIEGAAIESGAVIGPFARLRQGSKIGANAHIGNFVETKNAVLGKGAKANHLTYLGDAEVGAKSNIGAGTITCNYDGFLKEKTTIGENVFIGSNSSLVAPVTIGEGAMVAAGSVITRDVEPDAMAVARGAQTDKPGWAAKFRAAREAFKNSRG